MTAVGAELMASYWERSRFQCVRVFDDRGRDVVAIELLQDQRNPTGVESVVRTLGRDVEARR